MFSIWKIIGCKQVTKLLERKISSFEKNMLQTVRNFRLFDRNSVIVIIIIIVYDKIMNVLIQIISNMVQKYTQNVYINILVLLYDVSYD
jgi:hypothetical protein